MNYQQFYQQEPQYKPQPNNNPLMNAKQVGPMAPVTFIQQQQFSQQHGQSPGQFPELKIPNQFQFENILIVEKKCLEYNYDSKFFIPSVGEISWKFFQKSRCCCFKSKKKIKGGCCASCLACFKCMDLRFGFYHPLTYETLPQNLVLQSELITQIFYKGALIGFIESSYPTINSLFAGRWCTSYPQLRVRGITKNCPRFLVIPENSCIPTGKFNVQPLSFICSSLLGWTKLEREIFVFKETNSGNEKISTFKNRRTRSQACFDSSTAIFRMFCDDRDWPHYEINFTNEVSQFERLLIMSSLVHFCILEQHFANRV